jgi:hypothetical protein
MLNASAAPAATAMSAPAAPAAAQQSAVPSTQTQTSVPSATKDAKAAGKAPKAPALTDPILKQIETGIEAKVPPQLRSMYKSIVVAGMAIMFSAKTHNLMKKRLAASNDIVSNVSTGIANMIAGISNEVIHKLPPGQQQAFLPAAVLASLTLMCQMLNYSEKTGGQTITPQIAEGCVQAVTRAVLQKFGVGQQQIQQAVQQGKQRQGSGAQSAAPAASTPAAPPPSSGGMLSPQPVGGQ